MWVVFHILDVPGFRIVNGLESAPLDGGRLSLLFCGGICKSFCRAGSRLVMLGAALTGRLAVGKNGLPPVRVPWSLSPFAATPATQALACI